MFLIGYKYLYMVIKIFYVGCFCSDKRIWNRDGTGKGSSWIYKCPFHKLASLTNAPFMFRFSPFKSFSCNEAMSSVLAAFTE